jgi:hypothetical protein
MPTPTYYKLSTYQIQTASGGEGLEPIATSTILAPFTTPPDADTIYTDGTNDGLDYVLDTSENGDGLATSQDSQNTSITKLANPLPASELAQSILKNTINSFKPFTVRDQNNDPSQIYADFSPKGNVIGSVSLGSLAKALGYDSFNYLQIVSHVPSTESWYDGFGDQYVDHGQILTLSYMFADLLPGGNKICADLLIGNSCDISFLNNYIPADTRPYYNDIPGFELPGKSLFITQAGLDNSNNYWFFDEPKSPNIPSGDSRKFETLLVGLTDPLGDTAQVIPHSGFRWSSNYACSFLSYSSCGGVTIEGGDSDLDSILESTAPGFSGGVTIYDTNLSLEDFSADELNFLRENGIQISETSLNTTQNVPEPTFVPAMILSAMIAGSLSLKNKYCKEK